MINDSVKFIPKWPQHPRDWFGKAKVIYGFITRYLRFNNNELYIYFQGNIAGLKKNIEIKMKKIQLNRYKTQSYSAGIINKYAKSK